MAKNSVDGREHGEHGWFKAGERSYARLMKSEAVKLFWDSYGKTSKMRASAMYQLEHYLDINGVGPEEALSLDTTEVKKCVRRAVVQKASDGKFAAARSLFYAVRRFYELNDKPFSFSRSEKKMLLKKRPKKIARQYIPTREDIYRMADSFPRKSQRQHLRGKAIILCLWQSGVRASCLCSWRFGIFKDTLWPSPKLPVPIKVVSYRPRGVYDVAIDTKLSSYSVPYYYTFLHEEAAEALREYLEARIEEGWTPKPGDYVFVTEGTVSRGKPLTTPHLVELVKNAAIQIGIEPESIWTHCLRKAFRKTLYRGGVDPDVAEALMGHKLPGSRGSYFDYHDHKFIEEEYKRGYWERMSLGKLRRLEEEIAAARQNGAKKTEEIEKLKSENEILKSKIQQLPSLQSKVERLEKSTLFSKTWDELAKDTAAIVLKEIRNETKRDRKKT